MLGTLKKTLANKLLVGLMMIAMVLGVLPPVNLFAASDVTINLASENQVIRGFGGMNHTTWIGDLTSAQRETAFGNEENQLGFSILRIHVDENRNNWYKELETAKAAIANGAIVFASPWNPPSDMVETFTRNGVANQKRLKYSKYADYAKYLNDFVTYMRNNGVDLYAISIQNEPDYAHTWTWWTPEEMLNFMKNYAGSIDCKVIVPESFSYLKNMSDPILNDAKALANMDILGAHFYGTQVSNMAYPLFKQKGAGKDLWMTEVYVPNSDADSADRWPEAIEVSYNMHNALVEGDFQAYVWWYIRRQYGPMKEDGTISKRGYCMAQYSKFVRPGYVRVEATKNPATDVYVSAYKGDNKAVIVAINKGTSAVTQKFAINNGSIQSVDRYRTSANENLAKTSNMEATANSFWAQLPANSVSTFVCTLSSGAQTEPGTNPVTPTDTTVTDYVTLNDGWYYIKNTNAQKYLQVQDNTGANGQNVEIATGTGVAGQKWYLTNVGEGYVTLKNGTGYMLDVDCGKNENGTNIQVYTANGLSPQMFKVVSAGANNIYGLLTKASIDTKSLDVYNFGTADGSNVCQWTYYKNTCQQWVFEACDGPNTSTEPTVPTEPSTPLEPAGNANVSIKVMSDWGEGATAEITVTNTTGKDLNGWTCTFTINRPITDVWNAEMISQNGEVYTVANPSWQPNLAKGESISFGCSLGSGNGDVTITSATLQ